jgi:hypothetical protein
MLAPRFAHLGHGRFAKLPKTGASANFTMSHDELQARLAALKPHAEEPPSSQPKPVEQAAKEIQTPPQAAFAKAKIKAKPPKRKEKKSPFQVRKAKEKKQAESKAKKVDLEVVKAPAVEKSDQAQLKDLKKLREQIEIAGQDIMQLLGDASRDANRAGEILCYFKKKYGTHGQWLPWLAENCPWLKVRNVQRWMKLHKQKRQMSYLDLLPEPEKPAAAEQSEEASAPPSQEKPTEPESESEQPEEAPQQPEEAGPPDEPQEPGQEQAQEAPARLSKAAQKRLDEAARALSKFWSSCASAEERDALGEMLVKSSNAHAKDGTLLIKWLWGEPTLVAALRMEGIDAANFMRDLLTAEDEDLIKKYLKLVWREYPEDPKFGKRDMLVMVRNLANAWTEELEAKKT